MFQRTGYALLAVLIVWLANEFGHMIALRIEGAPIETINIGIHLPSSPKPCLNPPHLGKIKIIVNQFPLGVAVQCQNNYQEGSWPNHSLTNAAGVIANLLLAIPFLITLLNRLKRQERMPRIVVLNIVFISLLISPDFVFPALSVGVFFFLLFSKWQREMAGPLSIFMIGQAMSKNFRGFGQCLSFFSLALATINSLPFFPLAGGIEIKSILLFFDHTKTAAEIYEFFSWIIVFILAFFFMFRPYRIKNS